MIVKKTLSCDYYVVWTRPEEAPTWIPLYIGFSKTDAERAAATAVGKVRIVDGITSFWPSNG